MVRSQRWSAAVFALQVALNSLLGLAFARALAHRFGATAEKDAFDISYAIPFLILKLCGFALIHGLATTRFTRLRTTAGPERASVVFSSVLTSMLLACAVLTVGCLAGVVPLARLLAPGLSATAQEQLAHMMLLMLPLTFALGIGTFLSGILIAYEVPLSSEFPQIASRVGSLGWLWLASGTTDLATIAGTLVVGAVAAVVCQAWVLTAQTPIRYRVMIDRGNAEFREITRQIPGLLVSALVAQIAYFNMQRLASCDGPGSVALINYSLGIVAPLSLLIGKPVCLAFGPRCAALIAEQRPAEAIRQTLQLTAVVFLVTIPLSWSISMHADRLIGILYGGGAFDEATVSRAAGLCRTAAWAIPAAVMYWITLIPILSIRRSEYSGFVLSGGNVVQIALSLLLFPQFQLTGLVWAYVIAMFAQAAASLGLACLLHSPSFTAPAPGSGMSPVR
jgi:putative peptidoglycan lipid II flippase